MEHLVCNKAAPSKHDAAILIDSANAEWPALLSNVKPVMDSLSTRYPWGAGAEANADMTPIKCLLRHGGLRIDREYLCTVVGSLCSVYSAFYCRIAEASPLEVFAGDILNLNFAAVLWMHRDL